MNNLIIFCLFAIFLIPVMYAYALPGDAELVLQNIDIDSSSPKNGELVSITADVYNAGLKNTNSFTSMVTVAYFVDGNLLYIDEIGNVAPGLTNKIQISSPPIWKFESGDHELKIILDYYDTLDDKYDSPFDNILERTFSIQPLEPTTISVDLSSPYVIQGDIPTISVSLTSSDTNIPVINKKIILNFDDDVLYFTTNKDGVFSFSSTILPLGPIKIESHFEGDEQYLPSNSTSTIYSFPKETKSSLIIKILDLKNQYDFKNYVFDIFVFQDSYDHLITNFRSDSATLINPTSLMIPLPEDHTYFAEIYLEGRLFSVIDKDLLKKNSLLVKELTIPERATINFNVLDGKNIPIQNALVENWIYSVSVDNGFTDWIDVIPTNYGEPYIAEISLPDQTIILSDPFFLFSEERKTISVIVSDPLYESNKIPYWIKNNAGWWADGLIDDSSFIEGIQFLIKENILQISLSNQDDLIESNKIPYWIKNNAGWWADGLIDDSSFIEGIQFLVDQRILNIE